MPGVTTTTTLCVVVVRRRRRRRRPGVAYAVFDVVMGYR